MPELTSWTPEDWTALATGATALTAAVAAIVAFVQVGQARRAREEQIRPFVLVHIASSAVWTNIFNLVIENLGATLARDVTIEFDPPVTTSLSNYDLASTLLFTKGIPSLPPRGRIEVMFDVSHDRAEANLPMRYDVRVQYCDARGRPQEPLSYPIDLEYLYGLEQVTQYGIHHAAKALQDIQRTLRTWTASENMLGVAIHDEDAHRLDRRIEAAMTGRRPSAANKRPSDIVMAMGRSVLVRSAVVGGRTVWRTLRKTTERTQ